MISIILNYIQKVVVNAYFSPYRKMKPGLYLIFWDELVKFPLHMSRKAWHAYERYTSYSFEIKVLKILSCHIAGVEPNVTMSTCHYISSYNRTFMQA